MFLPFQVCAFPVLNPNKTLNQAWLRPQLYWNPQLRTDANGQTSFSFGQPEDQSTFRIQLLAQGADGRMGEGSILYSVERK